MKTPASFSFVQFERTILVLSIKGKIILNTSNQLPESPGSKYYSIFLITSYLLSSAKPLICSDNLSSLFQVADPF